MQLITAILLFIFWPGLLLAPAQQSIFFGLNVPAGGGAPPSRPTTTIALAANSLTASVTTMGDLSGNGFNVTAQNSPTWAAGQTPNGTPAITMNGTNQFLFVTGFTAITNLPSLCVYAVIKPTSLSVEGVLTANQFTGSRSLMVAIGDTSEAFSGELFANAQEVVMLGSSTTVLSLNTWVDTATCYNSSTGAVSFFVNGVAAGTATNVQTIADGIDTFFSDGGSNFFAGQWAEIDVAPGPFNSGFHTFFVSSYGI
jgi:hypothetical protein